MCKCVPFLHNLFPVRPMDAGTYCKYGISAVIKGWLICSLISLYLSRSIILHIIIVYLIYFVFQTFSYKFHEDMDLCSFFFFHCYMQWKYNITWDIVDAQEIIIKESRCDHVNKAQKQKANLGITKDQEVVRNFQRFSSWIHWFSYMIFSWLYVIYLTLSSGSHLLIQLVTSELPFSQF